jgi:hypothetical protein
MLTETKRTPSLLSDIYMTLVCSVRVTKDCHIENLSLKTTVVILFCLSRKYT